MTFLHAAKSLLTLIGTIGFSASAFAQGLDELPPDVEAVAVEYVQQCEAAGGQPDFNPLDYVTLMFFGKDWSEGGYESYIVDTSALTCAGPPRGRPARTACAPWRCSIHAAKIASWSTSRGPQRTGGCSDPTRRSVAPKSISRSAVARVHSATALPAVACSPIDGLA